MSAPWGEGKGTSGGDQRLMQIFGRLVKYFDIDIYTTPGGKKTLKKMLPKAKYFVTDNSFDRFGVFISYVFRSKWISKEILKRKYQLVYSGSDFFPDVCPAYKYRKLNDNSRWIQCIYHIYPDWRERPGSKAVNYVGVKIQNYSFSKIRVLADKIINLNKQVKHELLTNRKFTKGKIEINPCGIDLKYFDKISVRKKPNQVCFLARLAHSKGIFDLPKIWKEVVQKNPKVMLKIIGGGSDEIKMKLKKKFEERGLLRNVDIMGFVPDDKAYKILKESSLYVIPSYEEGFGIAIAEALACSTPAIAWNLPVYKEVYLKGLTSVPIKDCHKFALAIIRLLSNKSSLKKLAAGGKEAIKKYNWDAIAKKEYEIINSIEYNRPSNCQ